MIIAVGIPTFILIAALALDFGSWYAHKRAVQNRADAAAFAAGVAYGYLFPECSTNTALANQIADAARAYAGVPPSTYNANTVDPAADVTVNPDGPNPCQPHPTGDYSSPNGSIWTDVHLKQTVPSLFGGFGFVPSITANARVAVMKLESMTGFRPLAIANPDYTTGECAWAIFENTGEGTITVPLALDNGHWRATRDIEVTGNDVPVNVRIGDCNSVTQTVTYDDVGYIGQYSQGGGGGQPEFQGIFFTALSGDCGGAFTRLYISRRSPGCSFLVTAFIGHDPSQEITSVTADINGSVALLGPPQGDTFQGTVPASQLLAGSGEGVGPNGTIPVDLTVDYETTGGGPGGSIDFDHVQQFMAGNDVHEGPITAFTLSQIEVNQNNTIDDEQIDLVLEPLTNAGPTTVLRALGGGNHTLNGVVDCTDGQTFAERFQNGCTSTFQVHPPSLCSGPATDPASCIQGVAPDTAPVDAYNALWAPGGNCTNTPNQWGAYPNIPRGDPRLITVPVTRIGNEFSVGDDHPVIGFAALYVTGWTGMPAGCGDPIPPATAPLGNEVWGHFIRFVEPSGAGTPQRTANPTADLCDPNSTDIAACIATLVQ